MDINVTRARIKILHLLLGRDYFVISVGII